MNQNSADVLIIGGGAIGVCSAHYLSERGRKVILVEKGDICSGSSYGNAGLVVPSHSIPLPTPGVISKGLKWMLNPESPFYIKPRFDLEFFSWLWKFRAACKAPNMLRTMPVIRDLSLASLNLFKELAQDLEFGFKQKGWLVLFRTEQGLREGIEEAHLLQSIGLEAPVLSADEAAKMLPGKRVQTCGAVYYPQDSQLLPAQFVKGMASRAEQNGVEIHTGTEVLGFEANGSRVRKVQTTRGDFEASEVVLAGGSWSPVIARNLGIRLPIQAAKGYSITVKCPPERQLPVPVMMAEAKTGITPMGEDLRFAGTLELAGLDLSINRRRVDAIINNVPKYLPDLNPKQMDLVEIWRGLRPCTPDGLPFLGRSPAYENLIVAAGHAMIGISLSPITGRLVSQLVAGEKPAIDLAPLRVDRFS